MADNDLQITFGADTSGLSAGTNVAKSEVDRLIQAIALLQKTVGAAARDMTGELTTAINNMGAQASSAAPRVRQMADAVQSLSHAGAGGHGTIFGMQSGVFLELRALLDEALSGRMRNFEGSFARLLGMIGPNIAGFVALNPLLSGFAAAAAVAAGGAAYLAYQMHVVAEEQDAIKQAAAFSGNFKIIDPKAAEEARQQIDTLRGIFKGFGEKDVGEIVAGFEQMKNTSNQVIGAMAVDMANMWQQFGKDEKEAGKNIVKLFSDPLQSIDKIKEHLHQLTPEQQSFIEAAQKSGNVLQAQAAIQQVISERSANSHKERMAQIDAEISGYKQQQAELQSYGRDLTQADLDHISELEKEKEAAQKVDDGIASWSSKIRNAITTSQMLDAEFRKLIEDANKVADAYDKIGAAQRKISSDTGTLASGLFAALKAGDTEELSRLASAIPNIMRDALKNSQEGTDPAGQGRDKVKQLEDAFQEMESKWRGSQEGMKQAAVQFWTAARSQMGLTDIQQTELTKKLEAAQKALYDTESKAGAKAARETERATIEGLDTQIAKIQEIAHTDIELAQMRVKAHVLTAKEGEAAETSAAKAELEAINRLYAQELAIAGLTVDQIAAIKKKMELEDLKIGEQMTVNAQKAADAQVQAYQKAGDTILGAWNSQLRGLLAGTTNWATASKNILADLTIKGIEEGEKLLVQKLAQMAAGVAAEKTVNATAVQGDAGRAGAGAYAAMAGVPLIGPVIAPAAAAAAYAGTMAFAAFDIGAWNVPQDMPAVVHRNELVMPAAEAGAFRDMLSGGAQGGGGNVAIHPTVNINTSAIDGASVSQFMRSNSGSMMKAIDEAVRHGAALGTRRLRTS